MVLRFSACIDEDKPSSATRNAVGGNPLRTVEMATCRDFIKRSGAPLRGSHVSRLPIREIRDAH